MHDQQTDDTSRKLLRRTVLKSTAAGAGLAVLGGRAAGQDDDGEEAGDGEETDGTADGEGAEYAEIVVDTQVTDGTSVEIESVTLPDGGFVSLVDPVAAHDELPLETMPQLDEVMAAQVQGASEFLEAGTHEGAVIEFDEPLEAEKLYQVWVHRDTTGDEAFDYVESVGEEDGRYDAEFDPEAEEEQEAETEEGEEEQEGENGGEAGEEEEDAAAEEGGTEEGEEEQEGENGSEAGEEEEDATGGEGTEEGLDEVIELVGVRAGWEGVAPPEIEGETNPTLALEAGTTYEVTWENGDGLAHNFVVVDENDEQIVSTDLMSTEGETQTVEFEATQEMVEYFCAPHRGTMQGDVGMVGNGGEEAGDGEEDQTDGDGGEAEIHPTQEPNIVMGDVYLHRLREGAEGAE